MRPAPFGPDGCGCGGSRRGLRELSPACAEVAELVGWSLPEPGVTGPLSSLIRVRLRDRVRAVVEAFRNAIDTGAGAVTFEPQRNAA